MKIYGGIWKYCFDYMIHLMGDKFLINYNNISTYIDNKSSRDSQSRASATRADVAPHCEHFIVTTTQLGPGPTRPDPGPTRAVPDQFGPLLYSTFITIWRVEEAQTLRKI